MISKESRGSAEESPSSKLPSATKTTLSGTSISVTHHRMKAQAPWSSGPPSYIISRVTGVNWPAVGRSRWWRRRIRRRNLTRFWQSGIESKTHKKLYLYYTVHHSAPAVSFWAPSSLPPQIIYSSAQNCYLCGAVFCQFFPFLWKKNLPGIFLHVSSYPSFFVTL